MDCVILNVLQSGGVIALFRLSDNFIAYDKNRQPYTFSCEKHTETENLHAGVTENGFALKSIGNRFLLNTPPFTVGTFDADFTISYPYEIDPCFQLLFGYDKQTRVGYGLQFTYHIGKSLCTELISVQNGEYTALSAAVEADWVLPENGYAHLTLEIRSDAVTAHVGEALFCFKHTATSGFLAIDRKTFIGELIFKSIAFVSDEDFDEETLVSTPKFSVPLTNGGDIPYTVRYRVDKIGGEYFMTVELDGGTKSRPLNRSERIGQYVAEIDYMTAPYVGLRCGGKDMLFCFSDKENCFVDPNIFWDCQKIFFGDTALPICNRFKLEPLKGDISEFIFGYENLLCRGYAQQAGGNEFRFSADGRVVYEGAALNQNDTYSLLSPPDKKAVSLIDKQTPDYESIRMHLQRNHYFAVDEAVDFTLLFRTTTDQAYLSFQAEIQNVFETQVLTNKPIEADASPRENGFSELSAKVKFEPLPVGVYKIVFTVLYGDEPYKRISHAFEVYDPNFDICPPLAAGLPFMFTMNNEQKKLARNGFDLSNPMPSCDFGHYIACATTTPVEAEERRIWENLKPFGREWFAWLGLRTCNDYMSPTHAPTLKNADYLFHTDVDTGQEGGPYSLYPSRVDHWNGASFYNHSAVKALVQAFFREHPEYPVSARITDEPVTTELFEEIEKECGNKLVEYINRANVERVKKHNRELQKDNPRVKRSIYGPMPPYTNPTLTYHSLKHYGVPNDTALCDEYYSGFAIFEDYPFSCAYRTYRGPFAVMTILAHLPQMKLYPELYTGSRGGCIDGAVKNAHAPMGEYSCPAYQNSTLAFEYAFNTAYKTRDGFGYWTSYGFHRGLNTCEYMDEFAKNWRYVREHKPVRPLRSIAYIIDFDETEDMYRRECNCYNQSESGVTVVYECARESGVPNGFGVTSEMLDTLTERDCDLLVLPSLKNASPRHLAKLRELYLAGVNLIAVSDVTGLEDIFGVEAHKQSATVFSLSYNGEREYVYNTEATFAYRPTTAEVTVTANDSIPAVLCTARTALINTALFSLGCAEKTKMTVAKGAFIVGSLIRKALVSLVTQLSEPLAFGENVGVTVFEDENQSTVLFAVNYTPFDNAVHGDIEAVVRINIPGITDALSDIPVKKGKKDGVIRELRFPVRPFGFAFITLR